MKVIFNLLRLRGSEEARHQEAIAVSAIFIHLELNMRPVDCFFDCSSIQSMVEMDMLFPFKCGDHCFFFLHFLEKHSFLGDGSDMWNVIRGDAEFPKVPRIWTFRCGGQTRPHQSLLYCGGGGLHCLHAFNNASKFQFANQCGGPVSSG